MKIPSLRAKFKPKKAIQNIHFGKMFLLLLMVATMLFSSFDVVQASEPLYYYDRYSLIDYYDYEWGDSDTGGYGSAGGYIGITFDKKTGYFSTYGDYKIIGSHGDWGVVYEIWDRNTAVQHSIASNGRLISRYAEVFHSGKGQGDFIDRIIAKEGSFPERGAKDGYWYIRRGLANRAPTLSLSTPSENSYFV